MPARRRAVLMLLGGSLLQGVAAGQALDAPNPVEVSPRLVTSGQPTAEALASLGQLGFQAVVYLAPSSVPDAVSQEQHLLRRQGIEFVHLPIPFQSPTEQHFLEVSSVLARLSDKKVLVHCQVNLRASTLVFLHRVIALKEDPGEAYAAVSGVWSPEGPWRELVLDLLHKHAVNFRPL